MEGRSHALSGAVMFAAAGPLALHVTLPQLAAGTVLTAGAALVPDFDEPGSLIARQGGFLTRGFAHVVRWVARGHRRGTHSLVGTAVFTLSAWAAVYFSGSVIGRAWLGLWLALLCTSAFHALPFTRRHVPDLAGVAAGAGLCFWQPGLSLVPACVGIGVLAHIAGDELTLHGCPLLWPFTGHDFHLLPEPLRISTGKFTEHWVIGPLLTVAVVVLLVMDAGGGSWVAGYIR